MPTWGLDMPAGGCWRRWDAGLLDAGADGAGGLKDGALTWLGAIWTLAIPARGAGVDGAGHCRQPTQATTGLREQRPGRGQLGWADAGALGRRDGPGRGRGCRPG
jgi:hypothetical protein